ncbi:TetR/AcrR family transcriptional regulator [Rhodovibrionaceae bacterium A322]
MTSVRKKPTKSARESLIGASSDKNGSPGRIRERNRQKILEAAEQVFAEKGFSGATTQAIAALSDLPKANVHYYFGTKAALYKAVIANILDLWLSATNDLEAESNPREAMEAYIRAKVDLSRNRPLASRIFANEVISGSPVIKDVLRTELRDWVKEKRAVMTRWANDGLMDPVDPVHLLFMIWAATQTYADFESQITAVLDDQPMESDDFDRAADTIVHVILKGCGIAR